ncbi:MAG TPA: periplasmic heavy metal sensor [Thermoanaerobaculaceae bacterium]|nr:periplasmic heavy metal sensor [Thermoanaerobaculaceae bacterium]HPS77918.1 periplasmic heavy metal sensor [Thermoanaerobaculaceae bacterium]
MKRILLAVLTLALAAGATAQMPGLDENQLVMQIQPGRPLDAANGPATAEALRPKAAVTRFLALTPDQVNQWENLLTALETTVRPLAQQIVANDQQLAELLKQPTPDPAAIGNLILAKRALREQIRGARETYLTAFEALLTQDQKDKLAFIRRAERAQPIIPAFRALGLIPPPEPEQP